MLLTDLFLRAYTMYRGLIAKTPFLAYWRALSSGYSEGLVKVQCIQVVDVDAKTTYSAISG